MLQKVSEKATIRMDWRRERAYRVGLLLARLGTLLSLAAAYVNFNFSETMVVAADVVMCLGCLATDFLTRRQRNKELVWWPFYGTYWIAVTVTLFVTGGIHSPFVGAFMALLFVGGVVIQSVFAPTSVLAFTLANFAFWFIADFTLPVTGSFSQSPLYSMLLNGICMSAIGICIYGFLKTEQELAEEFTVRYRELESTKKSLTREEMANAAKSSFLANISHEFRTPLSVIIGYVELLQGLHREHQESREFLSIVHRNGHQLANLVNDLLDLSKAEADRLEMDLQVFEVGKLLVEVRDSLMLTASKKNLQLRVRFANEVPSKLISDSARIKQILLNLIGNAIKFTEKGSVTVEVGFQKGLLQDSGQLKLSITDTGRGLTEEEKEKLFKPFSQADASMSRKFGGTGLGLNLSKRLAELLGGDVVLLKSAPNQGSTFVLTLDVRLPEKQSHTARYATLEADTSLAPKSSLTYHETQRLKDVSVLVVDDILDNRLLVQSYIQSAGGKVEFATDGEEGIEKALAGDFDLLLMDIQMPGMSGLDAAAKLREQKYLRPIVALSAHAMKHDRDRSLEAGCNAHLTKPIQKEALIENIKDAIQRFQEP